MLNIVSRPQQLHDPIEHSDFAQSNVEFLGYIEERLIDANADLGEEKDAVSDAEPNGYPEPGESVAFSKYGESSLFIVSQIVSLRDFKGQISVGELDTWMVCAKSVEEFLQSVWVQSKKHLVRFVMMTAILPTVGIRKKEIYEADFIHFSLCSIPNK